MAIFYWILLKFWCIIVVVSGVVVIVIGYGMGEAPLAYGDLSSPDEPYVVFPRYFGTALIALANFASAVSNTNDLL